MATEAVTRGDDTRQAIDWVTLAITLSAVVIYISLSAGLINFNKYLMTEERFPFAVVLVAIHMFSATAFNSGLFMLMPQLFPSLSGERWAVARRDCSLIFKIVGICVFFSAVLILSNTALIKSSVPFLQMMKESNLVIVYLISLAVAIEPLQGWRVLVVALMIAATTLTVKGEINFSLEGFILQGASQVMDSLRIVLQGLVLRGVGLKLDALSYVLITSPICFALLSGTLLCEKTVGTTELLRLPGWESTVWWPFLLANACVAVGLNISMAFVIQRITPMQFVMCGIAKDIFVVLLSIFFAHVSVSLQQVAGFAVQIFLVFTWNYLSQIQPPAPGDDGGKQPCDVEAALSAGREGYGATGDLSKSQPPPAPGDDAGR